MDAVVDGWADGWVVGGDAVVDGWVVGGSYAVEVAVRMRWLMAGWMGGCMTGWIRRLMVGWLVDGWVDAADGWMVG